LIRLPVRREPGVIVRVVEAVMLPDVAVTVVEPVSMDAARPELFTVAICVDAALHATEAVTFCVLPSVNVPVAVNCWPAPSGMEGFDGATASEASTAAVTVRLVEPLTEPEVAVIVRVPFPLPVARPELLMVARLEEDELHVTEEVMLPVVPSPKVPIALNC
jgi:hypothetical protein